MQPGASRFADRVVLPALIAGLAAWLAAPDATPAIAGRAVLGWSLAAAAISALWCRRRALHLAAAVLLALAAEHLLFSPGLPHGHDLLSHSWGVWAFFQAMTGGDATPQWLHHISLGLPLPLFYSPAAYYSMTPFYWLGLSPMTILKAGFVTFAVLGAIAMYVVARRWTGSSRAGLIAAAAYAFAPYRLLDSHYRQALGECAALAVLPLVFGLYFGPGAWTRRRIAAAAVTTGVLIVAHPLSVLTTGVAGLLWQAVEILTGGSGSRLRRRFGKRVLAAVLGLAAAGFYAVPMASRLGSISVDEGAVRSWDSDEIRLARQGLRFAQPLKRLPWSRLARSEPRGAPRDADGREVPHYLGWGLFACALLAGAHGAWRLRGGSEKAPELSVAVIALGTLILTFHLSATVMAQLPLLPKLQFAWRFLAPATFAGALAAGFVARSLIAGRRAPLLGLLAVLLVADAFPYTGAPDWAPTADGFAHFTNRDPRCEQRWGCWQGEEVPRPWPRRVFGAFLPPDRFGEDVAHVKPGYGEYLNPQALRRVKNAEVEDDWMGLGVGLVGDGRGSLTVLEPAPYAQWHAPGASRPRPLAFRRQAAEIDVELPGEPGRLVVLEQALPGWLATVDGEAAAIESTPDGLMQVSVARPATRARLRFRLRGADVVAGRAATFLALAVCLFLARPARPAPVETH